MRLGFGRPLAVALVFLSLAAAAAAPTKAAADNGYAPPAGCTPSALTASGDVCFNGVLVTSTNNNAPEGGSDVVVTDGVTRRTLSININWWQMGPPTAGQIITAWGVASGTGAVSVTHWIDRTHGSGPTPANPLVSVLDVGSGRVPINRMVWVPIETYAELPQYTKSPVNGDGDVHLQASWGCPAAGLTVESTPAMYSLVDHPGNTFGIPDGVNPWSITPPPDVATSQFGVDDPPLHEPVLALGQVRYDPGYGWWELHPIRAWRPMSPAEVQAAGSVCEGDPLPHLTATETDPPLPAPWGFPTCGELPVGGQPVPTEGPCQSQCTVEATSIGKPETLSAQCAATGVKPRETDSQGSPNAPPSPQLPEAPVAVLLPTLGGLAVLAATRLHRARSPRS